MSKATQSYKATGEFDLFLNVVGISWLFSKGQSKAEKRMPCSLQDMVPCTTCKKPHVKSKIQDGMQDNILPFWGGWSFCSFVVFVGFFVGFFCFCFSDCSILKQVQSLLAKETNSIIADFLPIWSVLSKTSNAWKSQSAYIRWLHNLVISYVHTSFTKYNHTSTICKFLSWQHWEITVSNYCQLFYLLKAAAVKSKIFLDIFSSPKFRYSVINSHLHKRCLLFLERSCIKPNASYHRQL